MIYERDYLTDNLEIYKSGFINEVRGSKDFVLKTYKDNASTVFVPSSERFKREFSALSIFGGRLAPRVLNFYPTESKLVIEKIKGDNVHDLIENGVCPQHEASFYYQLGEKLSQIHREEVAVPYSADFYFKWLAKKANHDLDIFVNSGLPDEALINIPYLKFKLQYDTFPRIEKVFRCRRNLCYTHGDYWTNNAIGEIIDGNAKLNAIIDWEFSLFGVPEEDLSQVYMWEFMKRPKARYHFEQAYGPVNYQKLEPFIMIKLLDYFEGSSIEEWKKETGSQDGFLTSHLDLLKEILSQPLL